MTTANGYTWFENVAALVKDTPKDSITSRTFYQDEHVKAVLFGFDAGQSLSKHTAAMPAPAEVGTVALFKSTQGTRRNGR